MNTTMNAPARIAIIGGGWSGLSCAQKISEENPFSAQITVIDIAPQPGGRARGLAWPMATPPLLIDNGQHLTIGAYTETFDLLFRVGAPQWQADDLIWSGIGRDGHLQQQWRIPSAAWPWRIALTVAGPFAAKGWPISWRWSVLKSLAKMVLQRWQSDQTIQQWLTANNTPQELIEHFWQPLAQGALNTEIQTASANTFFSVMKDSFAGGAGATRVLTPKQNLSLDGVNAITKWLSQKGVNFLFGQQAIRIEPNRGVYLRSGQTEIFHPADLIVLAMPADCCDKIWQASKLPPTSISQRWPEVGYRAITTVWVALDAKSQKTLSRLPHWFVLNPVQSLPHIAQVGVQRPGVLALVISAQLNDYEIISETAKEDLCRQVHGQLGIDITALPQKWITEKKATWAATLDHPLPCADEILGNTGVAGVFRAADDLEVNYPATIESAVRSGFRTARQVLLTKPI
jgi:protoporphyrinogen oxidase